MSNEPTSTSTSTTTTTASPPTRLPVPYHPTPPPPHTPLQGQHIQLRALSPNDTGLHSTLASANWTFMPYGPFPTPSALSTHLSNIAASTDPLFYTLLLPSPSPSSSSSSSAEPTTPTPVGHAAYLNISPSNRSVEIGHIIFSPLIQRTRAATEAIYLLLAHAFALGYRRVEWKCDALNGPSRSAAQRFGFVFEGVFRQHMIVKGFNRDTAWFSILDGEWDRGVREGFESWLEEGNFDERGVQRTGLGECIEVAKGGKGMVV